MSSNRIVKLVIILCIILGILFALSGFAMVYMSNIGTSLYNFYIRLALFCLGLFLLFLGVHLVIVGVSSIKS
ncbi:MAG TPA: hypothetical protein EYH40_01110 [Desulfurococcales archaeon]|nr:hypothetical protein [Desulfurococcales archaeon]